MMPEPIVPVEPNGEATELETLRKTVAELTQKAATRKARITALESNASALQVKATEAETRIKALTIDGPVNDLCESISVAPQALRSALESEYRIEMRDGVLTLLNPADGKPAMQDEKPVLFQADAIKNLLLGSKDEAKKSYMTQSSLRTERAGLVTTCRQRATTAQARPQFGLGMSLK